MSEKLKVGILGATGMVGQRFIALLENHPWFEVVTVAASPRSAGKTYEEAVGDRWKMDTPMPEAVKKLIVHNVNEVEEVASTVDFVFSAVDMSKDEIKAIEDAYAKTETPVVSNNSAHRWTPDVPMVVPEINPEHMKVIEFQKKRLGTTRGFVAVKPNCSIQSYAPVLTAWKEFEPYEVVATTYQAISGAGKTFKDWPEMVGNIIPFIGGEEEKSEKEPLRIWGHIDEEKGVYNEELTAAYAAIANKGMYIQPMYYSKVTDSTGRIVLEASPEKRQVIDEDVAYLLLDAMHDVVTESDGTGAPANIDGQYVSGKTGTSSNSYDLWFAGSTDYLTASIWTGFDENTDIGKYTGNESYHERMWSKIMNQIHQAKGYQYREFEKPESVVEMDVCNTCGYPAREGYGNSHKELISKKIIKDQLCKCYATYTICTASGKLAGPNCPASTRVTKTYPTTFSGGLCSYDPNAVYELPSYVSNSQCILH